MFAAVAAFAAASCAQELENAQLPVGEAKVYTATVDGTETKAALNGKSTNWENNDAILIYDGAAAAKYVTSLEAPSTHADFTLAENETALAGNKVIAVYPEWADGYKSSVANVEAKTLSKAYLASNQNAKVGSYDPNTAIAMAYSEDSHLEFKNATALLKFSVATENVKAVTVYTLGGEKITGEWALDYNNGQPKATPAEGDAAAGWVELSAGNGVFEVGKDYYIAVYPQELANGFAVEFSFDGVNKKQLVKKYESSVEFKRNVILNIGNYEFTGTIEPDQPEVPQVQYWALVGTMLDNWGSESKMTLENGWYVVKDVKLTASDQFKFRANGNWDEGTPNRGAAAENDGVVIEADKETEVVHNGKNFTVKEAGIYSLYLNEAANKAKVVKTGDIEVDDPSDEPVATDYGLVGSFQGWDAANPVAMESVSGGWIVAKNVELFKNDEFKFVKDKKWDVSYGTSEVSVLEENVEVTVVTSGSQNMKTSKNGKYDLYLNPNALKVKAVCVEEYTDLMVTITIDNKANWSPLDITLKDGDTVIANKAPVTGNKYQISGDYIGSTLTCQLSSGNKTSELMSVAISKTGATVTLEETIIKLKVQLNTANAKQWWGNTMKIHVWNTGTSFDTSWPGNTMTSEGNYTWSIIVPSELVGKTINYLVHNGNGWQSKDATVTIAAAGNTITGSSIGIN